MNQYPETGVFTGQDVQAQQLQISKVLRNTYMLLSMTLAVSAVAAVISMMIGLPRIAALGMMLASLGLIWFVLPRTANSTTGVWVVFGFTALLGASLGPTLNYYLAMANGGLIVTQALGTTAAVFLTLSGYVLVTGKNFNFLGGFLFTGLIVAIVSLLAFWIAGMLGFYVPGVFLAINAMIALLMCGFILYDTSRIVNGGETNYLMATTALYLDIYNLFASLLHLFGMADD